MKRRNASGILLPEGMGTSGPRAVLFGLLPPCFHTNKHNPRSRNNSNSSSNNSHKGSNHSCLSNSNNFSSNNYITSTNSNNPGG